MLATMNTSNSTTSMPLITSSYTAAGVVMPMSNASSASSPPGCSG